MAAAEVNGSSAPVREEEEPMDISSTHTENYQTLLDAGLPQKVAESLDNIFQTGAGNHGFDNSHSPCWKNRKRCKLHRRTELREAGARVGQG